MREYIRTLKKCPFCQTTLELVPDASDSKGNRMFDCPVHDHDNLEFGVWGWWNRVEEIWALNIVINQKQVCFNTNEYHTKILKRTDYGITGNEMFHYDDLIHFIFEK